MMRRIGKKIIALVLASAVVFTAANDCKVYAGQLNEEKQTSGCVKIYDTFSETIDSYCESFAKYDMQNENTDKTDGSYEESYVICDETYVINEGSYANNEESYGYEDSYSYSTEKQLVKYNSKKYMTDVNQAADLLRQKMVDRENKVNIDIRLEGDYKVVAKELIDLAFKDTGYENEGDYLRFNTDKYDCSATGYDITSNGRHYYYISFVYNIEYLSTKQQEEEIDKEVGKLIKSFNINENTPTYTRIKKIYDYICNNIVYPEGNYKQNKYYFSAYSALMRKKAVCQGYSSLLYRMLRRANVATRCISSVAVNHAWNIVKIGPKYYHLDSTWDAELSQMHMSYTFFLKGDDTIEKHKPYDEYYYTAQFRNAYPISSIDYILDRNHMEVENVYAPKREKQEYSTVDIPSKTTQNTKVKKPGKTKIVSSVRRKRYINIKVKKVNKATGYQVRYATNTKFKKAISKNFKGKTTFKIKASKNKVYYVKVRAYKIVNGDKSYGAWTKTKKVKK